LKKLRLKYLAKLPEGDMQKVWSESVGRLGRDAILFADYYNRLGNKVKILTGDESLKSYQPLEPPLIPRHRRYKN
jgi:hypothetical protein